MSTSKKAQKLPDRLLQEMRCLISVEVRELTFGKKAKGMNGLQQEKFIEKAFHGTETHGSYLDKFLKGQHPHFNMFDFMPIENCRGGQMLESTEQFHCSTGRPNWFLK